MEFDPMPLMFACVHLACKIEEVHEIMLDRLLEAAGFGANDALKAKVGALELPLLDGIGFSLLVEPKPGPALRMLAEGVDGGAGGAKKEALARAESLVLDLAVRSDALLTWPASMAIMAALGATLEERAGKPGADAPQARALAAVLEAGLAGEAQCAAVQQLLA